MKNKAINSAKFPPLIINYFSHLVITLDISPCIYTLDSTYKLYLKCNVITNQINETSKWLVVGKERWKGAS